MGFWDVVALITLIATVLGVIAQIVDAIGKDHLEKRAILRRASVFASYPLAAAIGWLICWMSFGPKHDGQPNPERHATKEADKAKPNDSKVAHDHAPIKETAKEEIKAKQPPATATVASPVIRNPTPEYIKETYERAIPSGRDDAMKQFIGTHISWFGHLGNNRASSSSSGITDVVIDLDSQISFWAKLNNNRFLADTKIGDRVHVDGTISDIVKGNCYVSDAIVTKIHESRYSPDKAEKFFGK